MNAMLSIWDWLRGVGGACCTGGGAWWKLWRRMGWGGGGGGGEWTFGSRIDISMASARRSSFAVSGVGGRSIGAASSTAGVAIFFSGDADRCAFSMSSFSIICDAARMSSIISPWRSLSRAIASNVANPVLPKPALKLIPASIRLSSSFHSRSVMIIFQHLDVDCPSGYSSSRM